LFFKKRKRGLYVTKEEKKKKGQTKRKKGEICFPKSGRGEGEKKVRNAGERKKGG